MNTKTSKRPLSPHLQVYKPQLTSVLSILNRMTGIANAIGLILFTAWLLSAANGIATYADFIGFIRTWYGQLLLLGWTFSTFYHLCNGVRHLCWDSGYLFKLQNAYRAGYIALAAAILFTLAIWIS